MPFPMVFQHSVALCLTLALTLLQEMSLLHEDSNQPIEEEMSPMEAPPAITITSACLCSAASHVIPRSAEHSHSPPFPSFALLMPQLTLD